MELGINKQINCYSILPWRTIIDFQDMRSTAKDNRLRQIKAEPGTPEFEETWAPFLKDFTNHLREKGWLHITNIAIDERAPKDMDEAARAGRVVVLHKGDVAADGTPHEVFSQITTAAQ